jgi:hypothetical protein
MLFEGTIDFIEDKAVEIPAGAALLGRVRTGRARLAFKDAGGNPVFESEEHAGKKILWQAVSYLYLDDIVTRRLYRIGLSGLERVITSPRVVRDIDGKTGMAGEIGMLEQMCETEDYLLLEPGMQIKYCRILDHALALAVQRRVSRCTGIPQQEALTTYCQAIRGGDRQPPSRSVRAAPTVEDRNVLFVKFRAL